LLQKINRNNDLETITISILADSDKVTQGFLFQF